MNIAIVAFMLVCAVQTVRAPRLLTSALWLAGVSVSVAMLVFGMSAYRIAVIELSVGGGLVTVLMVFAITMTGKEPSGQVQAVPRPLVLMLAILPALLLSVVLFGRQPGVPVSANTVTSSTRDLDLIIQVILIFAGGLTVLGLLGSDDRRTIRDSKSSTELPLAVEDTRSKEREAV
jgi:NADH:ubiquinone oxidoreductase subunit 6 (subunit J)